MRKKKILKERKYKICRLDLRLTEEDRAKVQALANRLTHGNVSKLIVMSLTDRPIPVVEVNEADQRVLDYLYKVMGVYRNIGINYNQVVRYINSMQVPVDKDLKKYILELKAKTEKLIELTAGLNNFLNGLTNGYKDK